MEVRLLGPLELVVDGETTPVGRSGERALLALLATAPGRPFPKDRLIDALWPDALPANPENALQVRVSRLRAVVGPALVTAPSGYRLDIAPGAVDAVRFERLIRDGRYREALALWRGEPLAEFAGQQWAVAESRRLEELHATAVEGEIDARLEAGDHRALVADLEVLIAAAPLRERLRQQLMIALYRCGRAADALAHFRGYRTMMLDELGVEPSAALRELETAILREDPSLAAPASDGPPPSNVPRLLTEVIGRQDHIRRLVDLLDQAALITLTGPGGMGKTTLALATAHDVGPSFSDGVWFVPLARVFSPASVPDAVAAGLGVTDPDAASLRRLVIAWLAARRGLLILDNCEHLADACAHFVEELLSVAGKGLRVIATSREALGVPGEVQVPVPPLTEDHAVQLFVRRAGNVRLDFAEDVDDAAVRRICEGLDGMPLAIELAAARVNTLSPAEILSRLDDRFRLLTTGARTAARRHQTLRATVDWSHDLLEPVDQVLFRRLAIFRGGWTLPAADAICGEGSGDVLDGLGRLVNRSLVVAVDGRFRMLETIRAYAAERLEEAGERARLAEAHARYHVTLAEEAATEVRGPGQAAWLQRLRADEANLRLALDWAVDHGDEAPEVGLRLAGALGWLWYVGRQVEGRRYLDKVLETRGGPDVARARALQARSLLQRPVGCIVHPHAAAAASARESVRLFDRSGDPVGAAMSELLVAVEGVAASDAAPHLAAIDAARRTLHLSGDRWREALADFVEMEIRIHHGEVERALALGRRASQMFDDLDDAWGRSAVLLHLGFGLRVSGRVDEAEVVLGRAVVLSRDGGLPNNQARSLVELGEAALYRGDPDAADSWFSQSEHIATELGNDTLLALAALGIAAAARLRNAGAAAERRYSQALQLSTADGFVKGAARARCGLVAARLDAGGIDLDDAAVQLHEVFAAAQSMSDVALAAVSLEQRARTMAARGDREAALSLLGGAQELRRTHTRPRGVLEQRDADRAGRPVEDRPSLTRS